LHINDDESCPFRIEFKHLQFSFCKIRSEHPDFSAAFEPAGVSALATSIVALVATSTAPKIVKMRFASAAPVEPAKLGQCPSGPEGSAMAA
jgi:hypothetical protein